MPLSVRWRYRLGACLLTVLLPGLPGCGAAPNEAAASGRLTNTLLSERFTAGRFAGQQAWHPCAIVDSASVVPRSDCGKSPRPGTRRYKRIVDAERIARRELDSDSSATTLRARALHDLRWRDVAPSGLDRAVEWLERARRHAPEDPVVLNDLAVAYLELGERDQQLMPMLRALDAVERAFAQDSTRPSVLFNRALILQRLYQLKNAERAWARYLAVERHPRWRAEAEAHARFVEQAIDTISWEPLLRSPPARMDARTREIVASGVRQSPQASREFSFTLLEHWGIAVMRGDSTRAARLLTLAHEIGAAAGALRADGSVSLAVSAIQAAAGNSRRLQALATAHIDLAEGQRLFSRGAYADAVRILDRSEQALRSVDSPAARWAKFYRAGSEVNRVNYASGDRLLHEVVSEAGPDEPALVGKATWALGLSQLRRGSYDNANRLYREAAPYISSAQEAENEGAIALLLAEGLTLAGQRTAGRVEAYRALRLLSPFRRSNYLNNHLAIVAADARNDSLPYAALAVTDEQVEVSRTLGRPTVLALAYSARVRDLVPLRGLTAARADLEEAVRWAEEIEPGPGGDRVRAHVKLALGQVTRSREPQTAISLLADAIATYSGFGSDLYLPTALYEAALAARTLGDPARAVQWLRQAIQHVERQRESFRTTESRATFYETVENVFDEMIAIELAAKRPASAFQVLERGRIHAWSAEGRRASSAGTRTAPPGLAEIGASLPGDMLLVEYALLSDRIVIWTASRRGTKQYTVGTPRDSVTALVDGFARGASAALARGADPRARLFDLLLRPLSAELGEVRQLTIVPDRELYGVPFAALWDRATGRYVVERYRVRTVPSAGFYLAATSAPRRKTGSGALVVGNPRLDSASAGPLPPLPGAALEAKTVAGLYPVSTLLRDVDASRDSVLRLMPTHSIIHFAGHAVFNSEQPEMSYLALAPDGPGKGGILRAWEIGGLRLSNVQVVVLSACSSLTPRASRTGAIAGLAYSFLRAGAPATVSTLWDVNDGATTELLVRFHRHLAAGTPAAEALRLAQVEALQSTRPELRAPRTWAAFIYTGP